MKVEYHNWGSQSAWAKRAKSWGPLSQALTKRLNRFWRRAIQVFIQTAVESMARNIDTGMTVASFRAAAAEVRFKYWVMQFGGFGPKRGYGPTKPYGIKSMRHGEELGRRAYNIQLATPNKFQLRFNFNIVVYQHLLHEGNSGYKNSLDWQSLDKGEKAMREWLTTNLSNPDYSLLPLIIKWFSFDSAVTLPSEEE